jgi:hypothetical protein
MYPYRLGRTKQKWDRDFISILEDVEIIVGDFVSTLLLVDKLLLFGINEESAKERLDMD